MIRTPLRPLARILAARQTGENPDAIEKENLVDVAGGLMLLNVRVSGGFHGEHAAG